MTTEQILREFESLPRAEQEELARKIKARLHGHSTKSAAGHEARIRERRATSARLHGILRREGPAPTDEEIEKMRADYLTERYG